MLETKARIKRRFEFQCLAISIILLANLATVANQPSGRSLTDESLSADTTALSRQYNCSTIQGSAIDSRANPVLAVAHSHSYFWGGDADLIMRMDEQTFLHNVFEHSHFEMVLIISSPHCRAKQALSDQ